MLGFSLYWDMANNQWASSDKLPSSPFTPNFLLPLSFEVRRGCNQGINIVLFNITPSTLKRGDTISLSFRAKRKDTYDSDLVLYADSETIILSEDLTGALTIPITVPVVSALLDTLLRIDTNKINDLPYVDLNCQVELNVNAIVEGVSPNANLRVHNSLRRDNDSVDAPLVQGYPNPSELITQAQLSQAVQSAIASLNPVMSIGGLRGDVLLSPNFIVTGQTLDVDIPASGVTSFNGKTGAITSSDILISDTNVATVDFANNAVTSFSGVKGAITSPDITVSAQKVASVNFAQNTVQSIGGLKGAVLLSSNFSVAGQTLDVTSSGGVTSINGVSGAITTTDMNVTSQGELSVLWDANTVRSINGQKGALTSTQLQVGVDRVISVDFANNAVTSLGGAKGSISLGQGISVIANNMCVNLSNYVGDIHLKTPQNKTILQYSASSEELVIGPYWTGSIDIGGGASYVHVGCSATLVSVGHGATASCFAYNSQRADFATNVVTIYSPWATK